MFRLVILRCSLNCWVNFARELRSLPLHPQLHATLFNSRTIISLMLILNFLSLGASDTGCTLQGGTCVDWRYYVCNAGVESGLCNGDSNRRCCLECNSFCKKTEVEFCFPLFYLFSYYRAYYPKKWFFWRASSYPANQSYFNSFQIALNRLEKAGPSKKPFLFWTCRSGMFLMPRFHITVLMTRNETLCL